MVWALARPAVMAIAAARTEHSFMGNSSFLYQIAPVSARMRLRNGFAKHVLHQFNFVDGCEDFISLVAHALVRAASTLVSTPVGCISHCLRLAALWYTSSNSSSRAAILP